MPTVAAVDMSRPIWPASPAGGWSSGVDRLSSRPNGQRLVETSHYRGAGVDVQGLRHHFGPAVSPGFIRRLLNLFWPSPIGRAWLPLPPWQVHIDSHVNLVV